MLKQTNLSLGLPHLDCLTWIVFFMLLPCQFSVIFEVGNAILNFALFLEEVHYGHMCTFL